MPFLLAAFRSCPQLLLRTLPLTESPIVPVGQAGNGSGVGLTIRVWFFLRPSRSRCESWLHSSSLFAFGRAPVWMPAALNAGSGNGTRAPVDGLRGLIGPP